MSPATVVSECCAVVSRSVALVFIGRASLSLSLGPHKFHNSPRWLRPLPTIEVRRADAEAHAEHELETRSPPPGARASPAVGAFAAGAARATGGSAHRRA